MLFATVLYVATGVGGFVCHISTRVVRVEVVFWQFSNIPPNSASVVEVMTLRMILNYTFIGSFTWGIAEIGFFFLVTVLGGIILHVYCVPLFLRGKKHINKGARSYQYY